MGAIVLAGGKSSRMGQDKALLPWGAGTLLEHVVGVMRLVAEPVIVVADEAGKYPTYGAAQVIGDSLPNTGPMGGILTGLDFLGRGYHFAVACDMPHLQPDVLRLLMELAAGHEAAVPYVDGRMEPLCAVYHSVCRPVFRTLLRQGQYSLHRALEVLGVQRVGEDQLRRVDPDLRSLTNLNTLDVYEQANPSQRAR